VPLVHGGPEEGPTLEVFVREVVQPTLPPSRNRPVLLYLQGQSRAAEHDAMRTCIDFSWDQREQHVLEGR